MGMDIKVWIDKEPITICKKADKHKLKKLFTYLEVKL